MDGIKSDSSGILVRKAIDGRGYAWKCLQNISECFLTRKEAYNASKSLLRHQVKAPTIAAFELLTVDICERADDARTNRVDYRFDLTNAVRLREDCLACGTPVQRITSDVKVWPRSSEDTAAYAAASLKLLIRSINDDVY